VRITVFAGKSFEACLFAALHVEVVLAFGVAFWCQSSFFVAFYQGTGNTMSLQ
jgi:hypothetical protein